MTPSSKKGSLANFVVVGPWARADALRPECKTESSEILPVGLEWSQVISTLISSPTPPPVSDNHLMWDLGEKIIFWRFMNGEHQNEKDEFTTELGGYLVPPAPSFRTPHCIFGLETTRILCDVSTPNPERQCIFKNSSKLL